MRVTLIHNPNAGPGRTMDGRELVAALAAFGWRARSVVSDDIEKALRNPGDAVVVAGGDGTIGRVAKRLVRTGVPLGVIPTGTANNVARTLGVGVEAKAAIAMLPRAAERDVDLGILSAGGVDEHFLEGLGVGVFARLLGKRRARKLSTLPLALEFLARELERYVAPRAQIEIDGRDVSGDYLIAAVMNLRCLGPALGLAPEARFDDGALDVALVRPEHRDGLIEHVRGGASAGGAAAPPFEVHRARHVVLGGPSLWLHVDDHARAIAGDARVQVEPGAVRFLVPRDASRA